jgi:energy-coupling factor transporter transmembrane protein EcfT
VIDTIAALGWAFLMSVLIPLRSLSARTDSESSTINRGEQLASALSCRGYG